MRNEFDDVISAMEQARNLIVKLAGNLQWAQKAINGTEAEKDYNRVAIYTDDTEVVEALHGLAYAEITVDQMKTA